MSDPADADQYGGLTAEEQALVLALGRVWDGVVSVVGDGPSRAGDLDEARHHVHALQRMVGANAAARAHPDLFRPLGGDPPRATLLFDGGNFDEVRRWMYVHVSQVGAPSVWFHPAGDMPEHVRRTLGDCDAALWPGGGRAEWVPVRAGQHVARLGTGRFSVRDAP